MRQFLGDANGVVAGAAGVGVFRAGVDFVAGPEWGGGGGFDDGAGDVVAGDELFGAGVCGWEVLWPEQLAVAQCHGVYANQMLVGIGGWSWDGELGEYELCGCWVLLQESSGRAGDLAGV